MKRSLISENAGELSPQQKYLIMMHPARTRAELEEAVEEFRERYRTEQIDPGWAVNFSWHGEEFQSRERNPTGESRVRLSDIAPIPEAEWIDLLAPVDGGGASGGPQ